MAHYFELEDLLLAMSSRSPSYFVMDLERVDVSYDDKRSLYRFPSQKDESRDHDIRSAVLLSITSSVVASVDVRLPAYRNPHCEAELQEFCRGLHSKQTLRYLTIKLDSCYKVDADGQLSMVHHVAEMLRVNKFLECLDICGISIHTESAKLLAAALRVNRTLQTLRLNTWGGSAEGVQMLVAPLVATDPLGSNSVLQTFGMGCHFGYKSVEDGEAAKHLAAMLCGNSSLLKLDFSNYWDMTSEGGAAIGRALGVDTTLTNLNMSGCGIGADGVEAIAQHLAHHNSSLTWLRVGQTWRKEIEGSKAANALANMFRSNSTLTHVDVSHNPFTEEGFVELFKYLPTNTSLTYL